MNLYVVGLLVYGVLLLIGFALSMMISTLKCNKTSMSDAIVEGSVWSILPTVLFMVTRWSPYILNVFTQPIQGFSPTLSLDSAQMIGTGYLMMLGSWVMTTRMIHTTEIAVCKPDAAELAKFRDDLEKELKEKEDEKTANLKPT